MVARATMSAGCYCLSPLRTLFDGVVWQEGRVISGHVALPGLVKLSCPAGGLDLHFKG